MLMACWVGINMQLLNATSIPQLMRLVEGGVIDVSKLVTHCKSPCPDGCICMMLTVQRSPWRRRTKRTARSRRRLNIGP